MRATGQLSFAVALAAMAACATTTAAKDLPAIIVRADAQSFAELQAAVSKALNRASVTLADDALTRESTLTIEPVRLRNPHGSIAQGLAQGRETRMPEQFRLIKNGPDCVLVHARTGGRTVLAHTTCAAQR